MALRKGRGRAWLFKSTMCSDKKKKKTQKIISKEKNASMWKQMPPLRPRRDLSSLVHQEAQSPAAPAGNRIMTFLESGI